MLNQLLSQLGANTKITVGVSMSPSVGLEMIEVNPKTKVIEKYSCKPLDYDYSKREIADYDLFRDVLSSLFEELNISKKSNIILTLPSVHYGLITLPDTLSGDGITNAIISEVEQSSYIFKRQDPVISWVEASAKKVEDGFKAILYGAIQQSALDEINAACVEIGCKVTAIETSPNSLLKTLCYNNLAEEQMAPNTIWNLMVINPNSYSIITLDGKNVIDYREEPLALRSFVGEEIYDAIISSSQFTLQSIESNYLYIVSETDLVSAEVLSMKMPFDGNIKFLESNKYVQGPLMQASYNILPNVIMKTTPESIGSGIYQVVDFPIKFNLLGQGFEPEGAMTVTAPVITFANTEIELSSEFLKKTSMILGAILVVPSLLILYLLNVLSANQQKILDEYNAEIDSYKNEMQQYEDIDKKNEFDVKLETNSIQSTNRKKLVYYSALGTTVPKDTWLVYLKVEDQDKIDIIGRAKSTEGVYEFYKGLKMSVIDSNLRLNRLELSADSVGNLVIEDYNSINPKFYEFEITNMEDDELQTLDDELNSNQKGEKGESNGAKRRRGFLFEDFLQTPQVDSDNVNNDNSSNNKNKKEQRGQSQSKPPKDLPKNLESIEEF